ncbi:MAG: hypothetical protein ACXWCH_34795, partial [Burkholderiales bacterium]
LFPPRISFIIRSPTTRFASIANIIKGWNIRAVLIVAFKLSITGFRKSPTARAIGSGGCH